MAVARERVPAFKTDEEFRSYLDEYHDWRRYRNDYEGENAQKAWENLSKDNKAHGGEKAWSQYRTDMNANYAEAALQQKIDDAIKDDAATSAKTKNFKKAYNAA